MSAGVVGRGVLLGMAMYILALVFATRRLSYAHDYSSWLAACEPHRAHVERILDEEQASRDYYYLMVAESRCKTRAVSHRGAKGFWQLMPKTARDYGCSNPHDLECATRAAARYLKHLENTFIRFDDVLDASEARYWAESGAFVILDPPTIWAVIVLQYKMTDSVV